MSFLFKRKKSHEALKLNNYEDNRNGKILFQYDDAQYEAWKFN